MFRYARISSFLAALALVAATPLRAADPANAAITTVNTQPPSVILIGFVGGFVRHDNPHQQPVLLAQRMRNSLPRTAFVQVFENRRRKAAYKTILRLLDGDHDGSLSNDEKAKARIILFGHSWGAASAVLLARDLGREGVPVLLTVQVDSVRKLWQDDGVIPKNVAAAANFYQPHGLIHGRPEIKAADATKTEILGSYRFDYNQEPVKCANLSWFDHLTPSHAQSECDPRLWSQVETLVRQRSEFEKTDMAAIPGN